jgi:hypothetical protein
MCLRSAAYGMGRCKGRLARPCASINRGHSTLNALWSGLQPLSQADQGLGVGARGSLTGADTGSTCAYMRNLRGTAAYWAPASRDGLVFRGSAPGPPNFFRHPQRQRYGLG